MKKIVLYVGAFLFSIAGYAQQALWGGGDIVSPQINKDNSVTFRIHDLLGRNGKSSQ